MRILLDECVPKSLGLQGHAVRTVQQMGWSGTRNGLLLTLAQAQSDVFLTTDKGYVHQHNTSALGIAVVILRARRTAPTDLLPLMSKVLQALPTLRPGSLLQID